MSLALLRTALVVAATPLALGLGAAYFHQSTPEVLLLAGATVVAAALASRAMRRRQRTPLRLLGVLRQTRDRAMFTQPRDGAGFRLPATVYFEAIVPAAAAGRLQSGMQAKIKPLRGLTRSGFITWFGCHCWLAQQ
jgi:hypothetical protein